MQDDFDAIRLRFSQLEADSALRLFVNVERTISVTRYHLKSVFGAIKHYAQKFPVII